MNNLNKTLSFIGLTTAFSLILCAPSEAKGKTDFLQHGFHMAVPAGVNTTLTLRNETQDRAKDHFARYREEDGQIAGFGLEGQLLGVRMKPVVPVQFAEAAGARELSQAGLQWRAEYMSKELAPGALNKTLTLGHREITEKSWLEASKMGHEKITIHHEG